MCSVDKLVALSSKPFSDAPPTNAAMRKLRPDLASLLEIRNGFCAFESALVVFPSTTATGIPGIFAWNAVDGWRRHYREVLEDTALCFAHDVFGVQFAVSTHGVVRVDPETGKSESYADTIPAWADRVVENHRQDTAWPLAHDWQIRNGSLPPHMRLLPRVPFVLGGEYDVTNLVAVDCRLAMEHWGRLYAAIRTTNDGEEATISGWLR